MEADTNNRPDVKWLHSALSNKRTQIVRLIDDLPHSGDYSTDSLVSRAADALELAVDMLDRAIEEAN